MEDIDTHHVTIEFGRHKGDRFTRLPVSYLKFMINNQTQQCDLAQAELNRRGITELPDLELSSHAIDKASYRLVRAWQSNRRKIGRTNQEGLYTWLMRISADALQDPVLDREGRYLHRDSGVILVFEKDCQWPILKTVYKASVSQLKLFS